MPRITDIGTDWTSVTLTQAETWQCTDGKVALTTHANPGPEDGIVLTPGQGWQISSGKTVRYRKIGGSAAVIAREGH